MDQFVRGFLTPKNYFGDEDAVAEWENPERSAKIFLHTNSYEEFKRNDLLYLFGRRGTGKTAILRMLEHEINSGEIPNYSCSARVDEEKTYHELSSNLRGSPFADYPPDELVHFLIDKWTWVINTTAMIAVVEKYDGVLKDDELVSIKKYLIENKLIADCTSSPVKKVVKSISEALVEIGYEHAKMGLALYKIGRSLFETGYAEAFSNLLKLLKKQDLSALVFVDSIHMYNNTDMISRSVVTALIESVRQIFNASERNRILAKAAFPSEIYPRIESWNKDKIERKNLFIFWSYRDLVSLLAKRHCNKYSTDNGFCESGLTSYDECQNYLYEYLPESTTTGQGIEFDTLAYIIRHTQKKPREVILLLNIIYTLAKANENEAQSISKDFIASGVHTRLDLIVDGTLDIFNQVFDGCYDIVKKTLNRVPDQFSSSELDAYINEASSIRSVYNHTADDVKRMLLETGAVGIKQSYDRFPNSDKELIKATFEYQVKGTLDISSRVMLVVHPLLYEKLNIKVDYNTFIYPIPHEGVEHEMLNKKLGINIV